MTAGKELVATFQSKDLAELAADLSEAGLDALIESDAIKDVPIIGSLRRLGSAVGSYRDHMLAKKVVRFLAEISHLTEAQRVRVMNEIATGDEERERVGETIIDLIDKTDAAEKPELIGRLFTAAGKSQIPATDVTRLAAIVTRVYIDHLRLLRTPDTIDALDPSIKSVLHANGLMSLSVRAEPLTPPEGGGVSMLAMSGSLSRAFLMEYALTADAKTIAQFCFRQHVGAA